MRPKSLNQRNLFIFIFLVAGHSVSPCRVAGCYAPGGRYPLPSSVIMTAVTARAAGCEIVVLASPRPATITLAAAYKANADFFICVGGAQAGKNK